MTAPTTLPRPAQASASSAPRAATGQAQRTGTGGPNSMFAQLLRGQGDEPQPATPTSAGANDPGRAADTDTGAGKPADRERDRKSPQAEDTTSAPPAVPTTVPDALPKPDGPSTWTLAGMAASVATDAAATAATAAPGEAVPATGAAAATAATNDPLAALRDAMGHGAVAHRKQGLAEARGAGPDATQAAKPIDAAGSFGRALGEATAEPAAATAKPAAAPELASPAADGALPSLGAVTDPASALHTTPSAPAEAASPTAHASLPASPGTAAFGPALGAQLSTWLKDGVQHASLELHPQDLGPIDIRIAVKDGQTHIDLTADVASTRQALGDALPQLSAALGDVGLSLSGGGVSDPSAQGQRDGGNDEAGRSASRASTRATGLSDATADLASRAPAAARQHRGLLDLYA